MASSEQLYPLAGQDGAAIPLDIILPESLCILTHGESVSLPAGTELFIATATEQDALLHFLDAAPTTTPGAAVSKVWYQHSAFLPAGLPMSIVVPAGFTFVQARGLSSSLCTVALQSFVKWQGTGLSTQLSRKF